MGALGDGRGYRYSGAKIRYRWHKGTLGAPRGCIGCHRASGAIRGVLGV